MEFTDRDKLFGSRIKQLRRLHRVTQSELGEIVGLTQQSITAWETGRSYPDVYTLIRLAEQYQVSVDWLLGLSETPEPSRLALRRAPGAPSAGDALADSLSPEMQDAIAAVVRREFLRALHDPGVEALMLPKLTETLTACLQAGKPEKT